MSLDHYYKLLGLQPGASKEEVRRAYRRMVMRYHPDKNPSPDAEKKFIAIKEAYEVLTGKRSVSQQRRASNPAAKNTSAQRNVRKQGKTEEERMKEAKERYREQVIKDHLENEAYFKNLTAGKRWKRMKVIAFTGLLFFILMLGDSILPRHHERVEITEYSMVSVNSFSQVRVTPVKTSDGSSYWISGCNYYIRYGESPIYLESSWFFHEPIRFIASGQLFHYDYHIYFGFFANGVIMLLFILPSITLIYRKKTPGFTILYLTSYYLSGALMIYFIITNERWAHLLSLGFL